MAEGKGKRRRSLHEAFGQEAPRRDLNVRQCPARGMWVPSCFLSDLRKIMHVSACYVPCMHYVDSFRISLTPLCGRRYARYWTFATATNGQMARLRRQAFSTRRYRTRPETEASLRLALLTPHT